MFAVEFNTRAFRARCEYLMGDKRKICVLLRRLEGIVMIRKLKFGKYRLYSRKKDSKTGKWKNLGTFNSKAAAKKHERAVQYFKQHE